MNELRARAEQPGQAAPPRAAGARAPLLKDDFDRDVWCVLGLPIDRADLLSAATAVEAAARDRRRLSFMTPNTNWLVRAQRDGEARRQAIDADLCLADGAPVVLLARLLGAPVGPRAAGSDLFEALRNRAAPAGRRLRVFFFGGREGAAEAAARALAERPGGLEAAGFLDPGHGDVASMSRPEIIAAVNAAAPDFIVVALGAAKGQAWIEANQARLEAPVISHLGAVVDFTAGTISRAPALLRRAGLEWAWRIKEEPALWRRYRDDALGLARLLIASFAPQVLLGRPRGALAPAGARVEPRAGAVRVHVSGDLAAGNLGPVREAFRAAAATGLPIELDFAAAGRLDRAFLGLVLMLEKAARLRGAPLSMVNLAGSARALFRANGMAYPDAAGKAGEGAVLAAPAAAASRVNALQQ